MDWGLSILLLVCFLGVVLLLEGGFLLWEDTSSPEVRQLERRLRALQAGGHGVEASSLIKARSGERSGAFGRFLLSLPRVASLERVLQQAGVTMTTYSFAGARQGKATSFPR